MPSTLPLQMCRNSQASETHIVFLAPISRSLRPGLMHTIKSKFIFSWESFVWSNCIKPATRWGHRTSSFFLGVYPCSYAWRRISQSDSTVHSATSSVVIEPLSPFILQTLSIILRPVSAPFGKFQPILPILADCWPTSKRKELTAPVLCVSEVLLTACLISFNFYDILCPL